MREAVIIRPATRHDAAMIVQFIHDLAAYEKLSHVCAANVDLIEQWLFGTKPVAYAAIAEWDGEAVGFALYFYNFSTFLSKPGLYVEDVFVAPTHRGRGIGKQLFQYLAKQALAEGCGRLEWWVLDWNAPAIAFYRSIGAVAMDEWTVQRVEGAALQALAGQ